MVGGTRYPAGPGPLMLRAEAGTAAVLELFAGVRVVMFVLPETIVSPPYLWKLNFRVFIQ
jgi:hypothetical protein